MKKSITVDTKLIPLLGKPLRQSFSPRMQNCAYTKLNIDACYFPLEVENDHLESVVNGLRWMNSPGFAVTKPNKVEVLKYLDELDELAEKMGAVNTVVNTNGKLKGYNTDGIGAVTSLIDNGVVVENSNFFCLGAGGAGRAMCYTLAYKGANKIYISSLSDSGQVLADDLNKSFGKNIAYACRSCDQDSVKKFVLDSDVLLNNAGIGMYPNVDETWIDKNELKNLPKKPICFDATYNPLQTQFLKDAQECGLKTINGIGMVINQGAEQIKLWMGIEDSLPYLEAEIQKIIAEQKQ
jgi:shikimate dehydrogenase